jgi:hypothetical protein
MVDQDEWDNLSKIRYMPYIFTEHGIFMLLEYDEIIRQIIHALNNFIEKPRKTRRIGFRADG